MSAMAEFGHRSPPHDEPHETPFVPLTRRELFKTVGKAALIGSQIPGEILLWDASQKDKEIKEIQADPDNHLSPAREDGAELQVKQLLAKKKRDNRFFLTAIPGVIYSFKLLVERRKTPAEKSTSQAE